MVKGFKDIPTLALIILLIIFVASVYMALYGAIPVAEAAGSHSTHHIKIFEGRDPKSVQSEVNEWIKDMNSKNSDFNVINIELDVDSCPGSSSRSGVWEYANVMVWYES